MRPSNNNPTWFQNIQDYFSSKDIETTRIQYRIHLDAYNDVVKHADTIINLATEGNFVDQWADDKLQQFKTWKRNGFTIGNFSRPSLNERATSQSKIATRVRKNLADLTDEEVEKLKKAFRGIQARDTNPQKADSYFALAGIHWYPSHPNEQYNPLASGLYCHHHIPRYNPWHRAYLYEFENALRSVDGCQDVTLPYWDFENVIDIESFFPKVLNEAPFKTYQFPFDVATKEEIDIELDSEVRHRVKKREKEVKRKLTKEEIGQIIEEVKQEYQTNKYYKKGYFTKRNKKEDILKSYRDTVVSKIEKAMRQDSWDLFHNFKTGNAIIGGHDMGHNMVGETMSNQSISSFDPIFWFFHCNWDRLWWKWQQNLSATNLKDLMPYIESSNSRAIFQDDLLKTLPPFQLKTTELVDSVNQLDIDYKHPNREEKGFTPKKLGSTYKKNHLTFDTQNVSIRIKGVNRLEIPGSFNIFLKGKDNKNKETIIDTLGFFQPNQIGLCENCVSNAIMHFDFVVPVSDIQGKELSVKIESVDGRRDYSYALDNVTINARLLAIQD